MECKKCKQTMTIYSGKDNKDYYYCKDCDIVQFEEE